MDTNFLFGTPSAQSNFGYGYGSFNTPTMNYNPMQSGILSNDWLQNITGGATGNTGGQTRGLTDQLGLNIPTFQLGLGGLNALGNIYGALQANKLAKNQFSFAKDGTNTNLNNQIKSYNTALEDRARSRAVAENRDQSTADAYIAANRLTR